MNSLTDAVQLVRERIRSFYGPLTAELVRRPGEFGLGQVPDRLAPQSTTAMICGFCSTGCSLNIHLRGGEASNLTPNFDYPVNLGMACPKGWEALAPLVSPDRAHIPLYRDNRTSNFRNVDWNDASEIFCDRFRAILDEHGPESVAFLSTGQICSEEMAYLGAFAKFGMGLVHGDGNTRQCMATAVHAYKESFGFDAPPYTYADFEQSDAVVLIGSNLCIAHPIMWQRVLANRRNPEIVVIDPRRTETAMQATRHLAIQPKSDLVFFYGLARIILDKGLIDRNYIEAHTRDFDEFEEHLRDYDPATVAEASGIPLAEMESLAELIGSGKRISFWWTMGVNQSYEATRTAQAIINLALMTGNIGKPGTGANSITGQCNAMGSRLFSNTTNLLGGHDFEKPEHREKIAGILDIPVERIPDRNSFAYDQIIQGVRDGKIKGLWVIATNPAHSWIDRGELEATLGKLDFLVVQDMYRDTETAQHADLVLPAAAWGEKDGTFINSERRFGLVKKVSRAPGEALSDFSIFRLLADRWGCGEIFRDWTSPEAVFRILQEITEGQPCDISGIDGYRQLDEQGGVQWPVPKGDVSPPERERRLFSDGRFFTPDQKALFVFEREKSDPEAPDEKFPFRLLTGRGTSAQWHTQTRTARSKTLRRLYPEKAYLEIHPTDAERLGIAPNGKVTVRSRRAKIEVTAYLSPSVEIGQVFLPMHYVETNQLTRSNFDPYSRQPNYKTCAVSVEAA